MMNKYFFWLLLTFLSVAGLAQTDTHGWHLKDKSDDGYYGISLDKAYQVLKSKNIKGKTVIVAVIDSGIDTLHEDLKSILWVNSKEIAGNGIDDDGNGYTDDVHGWNFIGGADGSNLIDDSHEETRVYHHYKELFSTINDASVLSANEKKLYRDWKRAEHSLQKDIRSASSLARFQMTAEDLLVSDSLIQVESGFTKYNGKQLDSLLLASTGGQNAKAYILGLMKANHVEGSSVQEFIKGFTGYVRSQEQKAAALTTAPINYRGIITKDNEEDLGDTHYGNADVMTSDGFHGTHVAGIIAADRNNHLGMDGVADNVKIMMLRAVPNGDEHDKDIALAIRYAVDNGSKVINMSFGKSFSPHKDWVDAAVKYAGKHDVLIVQAAGNSNEDIDTALNFPIPLLNDGTRATNWILVGASGDSSLGGIKASFSNYGKSTVDLFAPGVFIYSTVPGGTTYMDEQGTSMASPVVAGVAALLRSYYPHLSAVKTKFILEHSVLQPASFDLSRYCATGGIVNAYQAVLLAEKMKAH